MPVWFLFGFVLIAAALGAAGAESYARMTLGLEGSFVGGLEVWRALSPSRVAALEGGALWGILSLLGALPGWLVFGVPGLALVVLCRPRMTSDEDLEHEESLMLFDELAKAAEAEVGEAHGDDDDQMPNQMVLDREGNLMDAHPCAAYMDRWMERKGCGAESTEEPERDILSLDPNYQIPKRQENPAAKAKPIDTDD